MMKQITIYKVVDGDLSDYKLMQFDGEFWVEEADLNPTTYIGIEGALYESIEHYNKVHGESFDKGYSKAIEAECELLRLKEGEINP